jgi:hypothetical protein
LSKRTFACAAEAGSALLVRVKANQPSLLDNLTRLCAEAAPVDCHQEVDRHRHGRQEHRTVEVFKTKARLDPEWQSLIASVARVSRLTWVKDTQSGLWRARKEVAYFACQMPLTAARFAQAVRSHWGIENRAHYVRDQGLGEDDSRIRRKPGMVARLRSFALNILRANGIGNVSQALYRNALSLDHLLAYPVT